MIKLTKNELYKIFHKKLLYVVLVITIVFSLLFCILDKLSDNYDSYDQNINNYKNSMNVLETSGLKNTSEYADNKTLYDLYTLLKEKNIEVSSPEQYYVQNNLYSYIYQYNILVNQNENQTLIDKAKDEMEKAIKRLDSFDWKEIVKEDINEQKEIECFDQKCEDLRKETIKIDEYRLSHNIPFAGVFASSYLQQYLRDYSEYLNIKDNKEELLEYNDLYEKKQLEKKVSEIQYMIDHELYTNEYKKTNSGNDLVVAFSNPNFMIAMIVVVLSATIVAEEFNKGTIKQLLVKPYSRNKIIISKMLAVLITSVLFAFTFNIITIVIEGLFEGDLNTIFMKEVIYNFNTKNCIEISYIKESLIGFIYSLPMIILLGIFVFALSTIVTNAPFALGMGFGAYLSESVFQLLINRIKLISFSPTLNYNLSTYMFGQINSIKELYFSKAIIIDIISFIILFIVILIVFNKKDIKNQ